GIVAAYVIGKPVGILGATWLITTLRPGQRRLPAGWAVLAGGAATAGIGFTVSLLVASLAFSGETLDEAKVGVLACAVLSTAVAWAVFNGLKLLSEQRRVRQLVGTAEDILDLVTAVDPERDHLRGPLDAPRFRAEGRRRVHAGRVAEDVADADASQVTGTPTFFINGRRHHGAYDIASLEAAIRAARQRLQASRA